MSFSLNLLFNESLPKIFLDNDSVAGFADNVEVVTIAAQLLIIAAFFQFTDALQVVALGALRGMRDVKIPTVITFIAYWIIGFPTLYYLSMETSLESMGIWIGLLAGLSASGIMLFIRFNYLSKKLIRLGAGCWVLGEGCWTRNT
ncbi:MATE family efflux transporter [Aequorivita todarodis]|uniref:MATE family efflux transporter n=1 Tax=Aequorivita todarodis TaxID=2036821 RepID=UPI002350123D|nr:MATE family efflux transporter [Aequorivita todarodis]MDC8000646.1 MATE family efflux transporter [Aequorivita todarodis]